MRAVDVLNLEDRRTSNGGMIEPRRCAEFGTSALVFFAFVAFTGCGSAGGPARAARPATPTAASALGEKCGDPPSPLVVDWSADRRAALESALGRAEILLVRYACPEVELLSGCGVQYGYDYDPVSRKEEVIRLADDDALRAQLPTLAAGPLLPRVSAELARGSSLDLGLVISGRMRARQAAVYRPDVLPSCLRATHYVSAASVGAFAMSVGARAKVRSTVEIFASVEAASASSRELSSRDGEIDACDAKKLAGAEGGPGPRGCRSPLRLELRPIEARSALHARCEDKRDESACVQWSAQLAADPAGASSAKESAARRVIDLCRAGTTAACDVARRFMFSGVGNITREEIEELSCHHGDPSACGYLAERQAAAGKSAEAFRTRETACIVARAKKRSGEACASFAERVAAGEGPEPQEGRAQLVLDLHAFACVHGAPRSCDRIGPPFARGLRPRGELEAGATLVAECERRSMFCQSAAAVLAYGLGVKRDAARAQKAWDRDCAAQRKDGAFSCPRFPY